MFALAPPAAPALTRPRSLRGPISRHAQPRGRGRIRWCMVDERSPRGDPRSERSAESKRDTASLSARRATPSGSAQPALDADNAPASVWGPELARRCHAAARLRHLARRTEHCYCGWVRRYLAANGWRRPADLGRDEAVRFLSDLATRGRVSASTRDQALAALLFLDRSVLEPEFAWLDGLVRAKRPERVPSVLTRREVQALLAHLDATPRVVATLLCGGGERSLEALSLRLQDVDLEFRALTIRSAKGDRDRHAIFPVAARSAVATAIEVAMSQHEHDLRRGAGWVELPYALERKYPRACHSPAWQWVFPATSLNRHPETGQLRRHHVHETVIQRAVKDAVQRAGIRRRATCHTLRHSFATHLLKTARTSARSKTSSATGTSRP
jgi:integron integrase